MESAGKSYTIPVSFGQSRKPPSTPSRPLAQVYAETVVKEHSIAYQEAVITNKELQLKVEELKVQLSQLQKQRRKADRLAEQAIQKEQLAAAQKKEKEIYLQRYYEQLDKKFRGGRDDLFAGLKKLEQNLIEMYTRDKQRIFQSLQPEREEYERIKALVDAQREQRDQLHQEINAIQRVRKVSTVALQANQQEELDAENQFIRNEIQRLTREKKQLQTEQRILKKILNVEQEHRRHGSVIAAGIRKVFGIKVREQRYKEAVAQDYAKNLIGLQEIITKRKSEQVTLTAELEDKKAKLQRLRDQNAAKSKEYSQLEDELFQVKAK